MLHAQLLDWYTYHLVLPELSKNFHVFAVDYPGHGKTVLPTDYEMTANQIGSDLALFIEEVCGGKEQKIFVTGNSSGGLLAMWLCSHRPDLIAGRFERIKVSRAFDSPLSIRTANSCSASWEIGSKEVMLWGFCTNLGVFV